MIPFTGRQSVTHTAAPYSSYWAYGAYPNHTTDALPRLNSSISQTHSQYQPYYGRSPLDSQPRYSGFGRPGGLLPTGIGHRNAQSAGQIIGGPGRSATAGQGNRPHDENALPAYSAPTPLTDHSSYRLSATDTAQPGIGPSLVEDAKPLSDPDSPTTTSSSYPDVMTGQPQRVPSMLDTPHAHMAPYASMMQNPHSFTGPQSNPLDTLDYNRRISYGYGPYMPTPTATSSMAGQLPHPQSAMYGYSPLNTYTHDPYYTPNRHSSISGPVTNTSDYFPYNYRGAGAPQPPTRRLGPHHHHHQHTHLAAPTANMIGARHGSHSHASGHMQPQQSESQAHGMPVGTSGEQETVQ